tara:strand:- start:211 stop:1212 length:1002 start_codon:yes stop_codon:yes gene_type:complete
MSANPVILSGIQPTGDLNIGTFIGAIRNWINLQDEYRCLYMVVDLHSLTIKPDPKVLKDRCLSFTAQYLACGIDPNKSTIFIQGHVPQHSELAWILNCYTGLGELQRMTQFKEKSEKNSKNINAGLLTYPVLMAADILLYQTDLVPVGEDQKQHLELTRDLAQRFNSHAEKDVFKIPEPFIPKVGARIMSLQDPSSKMSKSDENEKANLWLLDSPKRIEKKIKSSVTDSGSEIRFDPENKAGISNLLTIYSAITGESLDQVVDQFKNQQYGHLKVATAMKVKEFLAPLQDRYHQLMQDPDTLMDILRTGAKQASAMAEKTLEKVRDSVGIVRI